MGIFQYCSNTEILLYGNNRIVIILVKPYYHDVNIIPILMMTCPIFKVYIVCTYVNGVASQVHTSFMWKAV